MIIGVPKFRICRVGPLPGLPNDWRKFTPGTRPTKAPVAVAARECESSSEPTVAMAPERVAFLVVKPKPVITTSSRFDDCLDSLTSTIDFSSTDTSPVIYPKKDIERIEFILGTPIVNLPAASVTTTSVLASSFTRTVAPINVSPVDRSVTSPDTVFCCCTAKTMGGRGFTDSRCCNDLIKTLDPSMRYVSETRDNTLVRNFSNCTSLTFTLTVAVLSITSSLY